MLNGQLDLVEIRIDDCPRLIEQFGAIISGAICWLTVSQWICCGFDKPNAFFRDFGNLAEPLPLLSFVCFSEAVH